MFIIVSYETHFDDIFNYYNSVTSLNEFRQYLPAAEILIIEEEKLREDFIEYGYY